MPSPGLQAAATVTDVIDLITDDQAHIRALLAGISQLTGSCRDAPGGSAPGADRRVLSRTWAALGRLLTTHLDAEQEICYLTMTAARPPGRPCCRHGPPGYFDIREALAETQLSAAGSARWLRAVSDASTAVIRHFQAEDDYLLPVLGQAPPETRGLLGRQWAAFTLARLQDDAEADATQSWRTPLPRRHTRSPAPALDARSAARRAIRARRRNQAPPVKPGARSYLAARFINANAGNLAAGVRLANPARRRSPRDQGKLNSLGGLYRDAMVSGAARALADRPARRFLSARRS